MHPEDGSARQRRQLIEALRRKGIRNEAVLAAMERVPRHDFVPTERREEAYRDVALAIAFKQAISQPFTVAYQTAWLELLPGEHVLEIGTGSGYQAAVLAELGASVWSIERWPELHRSAAATLARLNYTVTLTCGDGAVGWPEEAPFDAILVTAGAAAIPPALLQQLQTGGAGRRPGRLVIPLGAPDRQIMTRVVRTAADQFERSEGDVFCFVPLVPGLPEAP